jgi:hypothetical protein
MLASRRGLDGGRRAATATVTAASDGSDQVPGLRLGGGEGRAVGGEPGDVDLGAALQGQVGQDPAEAVVAGQGAEDQVAVRGQV